MAFAAHPGSASRSFPRTMPSSQSNSRAPSRNAASTACSFRAHAHPASRKTPFPRHRAAAHVLHTHDPFVALGPARPSPAASASAPASASSSSAIRSRSPRRSPRSTGCPTSRGARHRRGWNRERWRTRRGLQNRWNIVREKVLAMQAICPGEASFTRVRELRSDLVLSKPVQPAATIWIGANSPGSSTASPITRRWMPIGGLGTGNMERLKDALARGSARGGPDLALFGARPTTTADGTHRPGLRRLVFTLPTERTSCCRSSTSSPRSRNGRAGAPDRTLSAVVWEFHPFALQSAGQPLQRFRQAARRASVVVLQAPPDLLDDDALPLASCRGSRRRPAIASRIGRT